MFDVNLLIISSSITPLAMPFATGIRKFVQAPVSDGRNNTAIHAQVSDGRYNTAIHRGNHGAIEGSIFEYNIKYGRKGGSKSNHTVYEAAGAAWKAHSLRVATIMRETLATKNEQLRDKDTKIEQLREQIDTRDLNYHLSYEYASKRAPAYGDRAYELATENEQLRAQVEMLNLKIAKVCKAAKAIVDE